MEQVHFFVRVFLFVLLLSNTGGQPFKGSKSQGQSGSSDAGSGGSSSSFGTKPGPQKPADVPYQRVAQLPKSLPALQAPVGPQLPGGYVVPAQYYTNYAPVEAAPAVYYTAPAETVPAVYPASSASLVPVQSAPQHSSLPETSWAVPPKNFEEAAAEATAASSNTQALDSSSASSPGFLPGPVLQSGETSNVVKEAELGNYQQQTEEFGYPAEPVVPAPGFPMVPLPGFGGPWGYPSYPRPYPFPYPYPNFDYRLLYGLYPPGTYSTFSKNHEKGTDYYHSTHYLKEHVSDGPDTPGPGQQQKLFRGV